MEFLNPLGLQGLPMIQDLLMRSIYNGHDKNVISTVVRLTEMSGYWLVSVVPGITAVLQKASFKRAFGFANVDCCGFARAVEFIDTLTFTERGATFVFSA